MYYMKWFKSPTDKYDDPRMKLLRTLENGNISALIFDMLYALAARINENGEISFNGKGFDNKMLANVLGFDEQVLCTALDNLILCEFIEKSKQGIIKICAWEREQFDEWRDDKTMRSEQEKKKETKEKNQKKEKKEKKREPEQEQKTEQKQEQEAEAEAEAEQEQPCTDVQALFHSICISYPKIEMLSVDQKCAIRKLLRQMPLEKLKLCFERAEESRFLRQNGWATFDWLIKYDNAVKVLNGNYANDRTVEDESESETFNSFDEDEFISAAMQRGFAI